VQLRSKASLSRPLSMLVPANKVCPSKEYHHPRYFHHSQQTSYDRKSAMSPSAGFSVPTVPSLLSWQSCSRLLLQQEHSLRGPHFRQTLQITQMD
jgi:hypothetical protein